jgi:hypothetical protein
MPQQIDPVPAMTTSPARRQSLRTARCRVGNDFDLADRRAAQAFRACVRAVLCARAREPICAAIRSPRRSFGRCAGTIDRLAHCRRGSRNSDSQGIRRSGCVLANHTLIGVHDYGFGLGPAAVDTNHRVLRVQASSRREICCSSFSTHSLGSGRLENNPINIIDYSRVR